MFNILEPEYKKCPNKTVFVGDESYIQSVKWVDFMKDPNFYIKFLKRQCDCLQKQFIWKTKKIKN